MLISAFICLSLTARAQMEAVDLGLSVKWASCNLGASAPTECGDYYAWAETTPKERYLWETLTYCTDSEGKKLTKYVTDTHYGTVDGKTVLESADDAATQTLGGSWRLPTKEECFELWVECKWKWTKQDGVKGFLVTSKKNGNSIFLPGAGYYYGKTFYGSGSGAYWSSSLAAGSPSSAYCPCFSPYDAAGTSLGDRCYGRSIRPVTE